MIINSSLVYNPISSYRISLCFSLRLLIMSTYISTNLPATYNIIILYLVRILTYLNKAGGISYYSYLLLCMTSDPIWLQEDYVYRVSRIGSTPLCIMYKLLEIAYMSYIYIPRAISIRGGPIFFSKMKDMLHICLER